MVWSCDEKKLKLRWKQSEWVTSGQTKSKEQRRDYVVQNLRVKGPLSEMSGEVSKEQQPLLNKEKLEKGKTKPVGINTSNC